MSPRAEEELQTARRHVREGRTADAEQSYRRVLEALPESIEALVFLGNAAQSRGDGINAVSLLSRASKSDPTNVDILMNLGAVYRAAERFDAARYVLERAVRLGQGRRPYARLALASVLELDQRPEHALLHYCLALLEAQRLGRWTAADAGMVGLEAQVARVRQYVDAGRRAWFERVLGGSGGAATLERTARIDAALSAYLDARPPPLSHPLQRAGLLHVPGIATEHFIEDARLAWVDGVAGMIGRCVGEMERCVAAAARPDRSGVGATALRIPVFKAGVPQYLPRRHAPSLLALLRQLPLADVQNHAPDVDIVALDGSARLARHYGRTNSRCWVIVNPPGRTALQVIVGGEGRVLPPGTALIADPSFGVEYLNVDEAPGLALMVEIWHPDLSDSERRTITALLIAVLDFDIRLQELD